MSSPEANNNVTSQEEKKAGRPSDRFNDFSPPPDSRSSNKKGAPGRPSFALTPENVNQSMARAFDPGRVTSTEGSVAKVDQDLKRLGGLGVGRESFIGPSRTNTEDTGSDKATNVRPGLPDVEDFIKDFNPYTSEEDSESIHFTPQEGLRRGALSLEDTYPRYAGPDTSRGDLEPLQNQEGILPPPPPEQ